MTETYVTKLYGAYLMKIGLNHDLVDRGDRTISYKELWFILNENRVRP